MNTLTPGSETGDRDESTPSRNAIVTLAGMANNLSLDSRGECGERIRGLPCEHLQCVRRREGLHECVLAFRQCQALIASTPFTVEPLSAEDFVLLRDKLREFHKLMGNWLADLPNMALRESLKPPIQCRVRWLAAESIRRSSWVFQIAMSALRAQEHQMDRYLNAGERESEAYFMVVRLARTIEQGTSWYDPSKEHRPGAWIVSKMRWYARDLVFFKTPRENPQEQLLRLAAPDQTAHAEVWEFLSLLQPEDEALVRDYYLGGMTVKEILRAHGVPNEPDRAPALFRHLAKLKDRLKSWLREEPPNESSRAQWLRPA